MSTTTEPTTSRGAIAYATKFIYAVYADDATKAVRIIADNQTHAEILGALHFGCSAREIIARYVISASVPVYGGESC